MSKLIDNLQLNQLTKITIVSLIAKNLLNRVNIIRSQNPNITFENEKSMIFGKNLYLITTRGSYLSPELANGYHELGILIGQGYGLTETVGLGGLSDYNIKKISTVGLVASYIKMRVIDREIQIKGRSSMKEYYKDPEKTKEAFTSDGWLHTGDIGYIDKDNYINLVGRKKNLIILSNGENISPEAIETLYISEPLIQEMIVYGDEDVLCAEVYPNFEYMECNNIEKSKIKENIWDIIEMKNKNTPSFEKKNC